MTFQKKKGKKPVSKEGEGGVKGGLPSNSKGSLASSSNTQALSSKWTPAVNSDLWWKAYHNLLERFENDCVQLSIPCFVSSVSGTNNEQNTPAYR